MDTCFDDAIESKVSKINPLTFNGLESMKRINFNGRDFVRLKSLLSYL